MNSPAPAINERSLILLVGLIQFVNILDFMMVMPLGPDFARALNIPTSQIGLIGGAYTFAAAFSGLVSALFLDMFPRKKALTFCLAGLTLATLAGAAAWDENSMLFVRVIAGMFGGPLGALVLALIADYIPPERRGIAMGKVAGAFAAASVLGVPFGLELAARLSWHAPFITTAFMGAGVLVLAWRKLPYHAVFAKPALLSVRARAFYTLLQSRAALMSYAFMGLSMMSGFMIIPNIAAHLQINLHYPREQLGLLYFSGGMVSFFSMRGAGWMVDRYSSLTTVLTFTAMLILAVGAGFIWYPTPLPIIINFTLFMVAMSGRMVAIQALSSKIPSPADRGAYMSVQSALMSLGSAIGAYYSSLILVEENSTLAHFPIIGATSIFISCLVPLLVWRVEKRHFQH